MAVADNGERDLELSRLFALTVRALLRRPVTALLLATLTVVVPSGLFYRFVPLPPDNMFSAALIIHLLGSLALISLSAILYGWMAVQFVGASDSPLVEVVKRAPSLFATMFVVTLVLLLGILALVVPGAIWGVATAVVVPAAAVERLGTTRAIVRSFDLTENRRWIILGFSILAMLPLVLAVTAFEFVLNGWRLFPAQENPFITTVTRPVTDVLLSLWGAALGAALYVELTRLPPIRPANAS